MGHYGSLACLCVLLWGAANPAAQQPRGGFCSSRGAARSANNVVRAALTLLPKQPAYVSLIDATMQEDPRIGEWLRSLEAFTLPRHHGVYLTLHGATLRRAVETRSERVCRFDLHVLAAIVWHEMAHLAGADEAGAQAREETLWRQFIRDGRIDGQAGLRQIQLFASRRKHAQMVRYDARVEGLEMTQ